MRLLLQFLLHLLQLLQDLLLPLDLLVRADDLLLASVFAGTRPDLAGGGIPTADGMKEVGVKERWKEIWKDISIERNMVKRKQYDRKKDE